MISTVTTAIVTTVTTTVGLGMALGLVAVIALIVLLTTREVAAASQGSVQRFLVRSLEVGIVPLLAVFTVIVALKLMEILS